MMMGARAAMRGRPPLEAPDSDLRGAAALGGNPMTMEFHVCWRDGDAQWDAQWIVRLGNDIYGAYLDKELALLDAVEAAREALQSGRDAEVWLRDDMSSARIL
jgi:hypothetical protein